MLNYSNRQIKRAVAQLMFFFSCVVTTSLEVLIVIMLAEPLGEYRPVSALMVTVMFDYAEVAAR